MAHLYPALGGSRPSDDPYALASAPPASSLRPPFYPPPPPPHASVGPDPATTPDVIHMRPATPGPTYSMSPLPPPEAQWPSHFEYRPRPHEQFRPRPHEQYRPRPQHHAANGGYGGGGQRPPPGYPAADRPPLGYPGADKVPLGYPGGNKPMGYPGANKPMGYPGGKPMGLEVPLGYPGGGGFYRYHCEEDNEMMREKKWWGKREGKKLFGKGR